MDKVDLQNVLGTVQTNSFIICFVKKKELQIKNVIQIETESFFGAIGYEKTVIFQRKNRGELVVFNVEEMKIVDVIEGVFSIYGAFVFNGKIFFTNVNHKVFSEYDPGTRNLIDLDFYFNSSYYGSDKLVSRKINSLDIFELNSLKTSQVDVSNYLKSNNDRTESIIGVNTNDSLFIRLKSGRILIVDSDSHAVRIFLESKGRAVIFKNSIFTITENIIEEFDTISGELMQRKDFYDIGDREFRSTGFHYVTEQFIFLVMNSPTGKVAVFEKESLDFVKLLVINKEIPFNRQNIQWFARSLFILDSSKKMHIFQNIDTAHSTITNQPNARL